MSKASRGFGDFANALDNTEEEKKGDESKGEEDDEPSGEDEEEIDVPPPLPTVAEALESLELSHLGDKLADEFIQSYQDLLDLSIEDLKELGLKIGERNRLKKYIAKANEPKKDPSTDPEVAEMKHYASLFESIDDDGAGGIDLAEFKSALLALGKFKNDFETQIIFDKGDVNGNGQIDLDEFVALMKYAKTVEGEREAILKDIAQQKNSGSNLGRLAAACKKHGVRMQDVFETYETPSGMSLAQKAVGAIQPGSASKCRDPSISGTVDFLILDNMFILKTMEGTCKMEVEKKIRDLKEASKKLKTTHDLLPSSINMDAIIQDAVENFRETCHVHSSLPENRQPATRSFNQLEQSDLHEFRLCAVHVACTKAVNDFPPIAAESKRVMFKQGAKLATQYGPQVFEYACKALEGMSD